MEEAFALFTPLARREWLSWGGDLFFSDMKEEVEREEQEEKEARLWEAEESERIVKREAEEETKHMATEAKAVRVEAWKVALGEARKSVLADFWAKTLSKEELPRRNVEMRSR
jgi:hypothetical protein